MYRSHSESYEELLGRAKLPTLYNRRLQDTAVLMYKVKRGLTPTCVSDLFARENSTHALRNCDFVVTRFYISRYGKHSILYKTYGSFFMVKAYKRLESKESPIADRLAQLVERRAIVREVQPGPTLRVLK